MQTPKKRCALSGVDDDTYCDVLASDILHTQQKLASLAHAPERAGKRLISAGLSYAERDLRALRIEPGGAAGRLALREILTDKLMQLERGVLQTTFDPHGGKSADLPSSGADGATAELCAPSLSRLPYLFALFERLQSLGDLAQRAKPLAHRHVEHVHVVESCRGEALVRQDALLKDAPDAEDAIVLVTLIRL